jgi:hypothetical protein
MKTKARSTARARERRAAERARDRREADPRRTRGGREAPGRDVLDAP